MEEKKKKNQQKEQLKKYVVFTIMTLVCLAFLWWIFKPSAKEKENVPAGLNTEVPDPIAGNIIDNKKKAYEMDGIGRNEEERFLSLEEYGLITEKKEESPESEPVSAVATSVSAYKEVNKTLDNFFTASRSQEDEQEILELTWRIQELERKAEEEEALKRETDNQLQLLERSYELAAKYMPQQNNTPLNNTDTPEEEEEEKKDQYIKEISGISRWEYG